tara:strand:+ start:115 stop:402 length:288 start_codon:yes stop_codon:yes gene_type:complete
MFYVNVWLKVKENKDISKVAKLLTQMSQKTKLEDTCFRMEIYHSQSDESRFLLCEHWDSESGWKNHRNEQHFIEIYKAQVLPLVEREPHICKYLE